MNAINALERLKYCGCTQYFRRLQDNVNLHGLPPAEEAAFY